MPTMMTNNIKKPLTKKGKTTISNNKSKKIKPIKINSNNNKMNL
jgi:hypothetical protein